MSGKHIRTIAHLNCATGQGGRSRPLLTSLFVESTRQDTGCIPFERRHNRATPTVELHDLTTAVVPAETRL